MIYDGMTDALRAYFNGRGQPEDDKGVFDAEISFATGWAHGKTDRNSVIVYANDTLAFEAGFEAGKEARDA